MRGATYLPALVLTACGAQLAVDPHREDHPWCGAPPSGKQVAVEWVAGGRWLLVGQERLVEPLDGGVRTLPFTVSAADISPEGTRLLKRDVSPHGTQLVVTDLAGAELQRLPVPAFLVTPELTEARLDELRQTRAQWWSERELLVIQDTLPADGYSDCRIVDLERARWSRPAECPQGGMMWLAQVQRGPDGLVALYSYGEGHPSVDVVAWSPERPQHDAGVPTFDLYPFGPLSVRFGDDPDLILFETPCDLRVERGCLDKIVDREDWSVFLFRWRRGAGLELVRRGLPPLAVYEPRGDLWAWPTGHGIALGDSEETVRCIDLTRASPAPDRRPSKLGRYDAPAGSK